VTIKTCAAIIKFIIKELFCVRIIHLLHMACQQNSQSNRLAINRLQVQFLTVAAAGSIPDCDCGTTM